MQADNTNFLALSKKKSLKCISQPACWSGGSMPDWAKPEIQEQM